MSVSLKSISPVVLTAFVLSACGSGGDSDVSNKAVSGSPNTASISDLQSADSGSGIPAGSDAISTQASRMPTPPKAAAAAVTGTASPQTNNTIPFFSTDRIRGDALLTMLDAKVPVKSRVLPKDPRILVRWEPWFMQSVTENRVPTDPPAGHPEVYVDSRIYYNGTWLYKADLDEPDNYEHIEDPLNNFPDGRYAPAKGDYTLRVRSFAQINGGHSIDATKHFLNAEILLPISTDSDSFGLSDTITLNTSLFSPAPYYGKPFDEGFFSREIQLPSTMPARFSKNATFMANYTIKSWVDGENSVILYWRRGKDPRDVELCWQLKIKEVLERTQCSTWTLQADWEYGQRFMGGGVDLFNVSHLPSTDENENPFTQWFIDGESSDIFHG